MASSGTEPYLCASYSSVVRRFHVYKDIWTPILNEVHPTQLECGNPEDRYAVSILKILLLDTYQRNYPDPVAVYCKRW